VARVEIAWHTKLPGGPDGRGHRMTQRIGDTLFQPTQWYPRVAKYDDLRGWDTSLYLGPAEFYNNFGRFDVRLDVPGGWIVSGTGVLQNPREVLTDTARERLTHVLESNEVITIVGCNGMGGALRGAGRHSGSTFSDDASPNTCTSTLSVARTMHAPLRSVSMRIWR